MVRIQLLPANRKQLHIRMWRLAGPAILANLSVPLLGAVDTAVMGHLPDPAYLGAIAVGSMIFSFLYWGFGFLRMGTTGLTAQCFGRLEDDPDAAGTLALVFGRAALLALALSTAILLLQWPVAWAAFKLVDASTHVNNLAHGYFSIRIWSAPATLLQYAIIGWLFGTQRAGYALLVQVVMNALNIFLDLLFVVGFGMGVKGVALGTVLAEYAGAAVGIILILHAFKSGYHIRARQILRDPALFDPAALKRLFSVNMDLFLRTLCLLTAIGIFTAIGARLGVMTLAANAVLWNFLMFISFGLDGYAHAAEALVGSDMGVHSQARFLETVKVTTSWAFATSLLYLLVYLLFGHSIIALLTGIEDVRRLAAEYLPWVIVQPLIAVWSYQLDGIFIGATHTRVMRRAMLISLVIYIICLIFFVPLWQNHGLWLSFSILMAARAITLGLNLPGIVRNLR